MKLHHIILLALCLAGCGKISHPVFRKASKRKACALVLHFLQLVASRAPARFGVPVLTWVLGDHACRDDC